MPAETVDHLDHIDRIIGEGHQGIVFECKVSRENKPVAIKRIQLINVNMQQRKWRRSYSTAPTLSSK